MALTAREIAAIVGKRAMLRTDGLEFNVTIEDAREVYGRTDYLVRPEAGSGERWVSSERVQILKEKEG